MDLRFTVAMAAVLVLNLAGSFLIKIMTRYWPDEYVTLVILGAAVVLVSLLRVVMWLFLGRRYQLSYAHPFLSLNYVVAVFLGMAVFGESLQWQRVIGGTIIALSVAGLARSRHRREERTA